MNTTRRPTSGRVEIVDGLLRLSLFASWEAAGLAGLLSDTDIVHLPAMTILDRCNTPARQFVGILDGYVRATESNGRTFVLGPGDHIGARELLTDEVHDATYVATTAVTLVAVFGPTFRARLRLIPGLIGRASAPRGHDLSRQPAGTVSPDLRLPPPSPTLV